MDSTGSDKFALEAFSLAFAIQRIFQSRLIPPEAKERLYQDYCKLKESVALLTKIREERENKNVERTNTRTGRKAPEAL
jgi:Fe-S cluster assembly scaffold protein SufB